MTIAITPPTAVANSTSHSWLAGQSSGAADVSRPSEQDGVLAALAQAAVGRHALAESTLAWQHLRPRGDQAAELTAALNRGAAPAYLPIAYTGADQVADRL